MSGRGGLDGMVGEIEVRTYVRRWAGLLGRGGRADCIVVSLCFAQVTLII